MSMKQRFKVVQHTERYYDTLSDAKEAYEYLRQYKGNDREIVEVFLIVCDEDVDELEEMDNEAEKLYEELKQHAQ